jgi:hypothetical protein
MGAHPLLGRASATVSLFRAPRARSESWSECKSYSRLKDPGKAGGDTRNLQMSWSHGNGRAQPSFSNPGGVPPGLPWETVVLVRSRGRERRAPNSGRRRSGGRRASRARGSPGGERNRGARAGECRERGPGAGPRPARPARPARPPGLQEGGAWLRARTPRRSRERPPPRRRLHGCPAGALAFRLRAGSARGALLPARSSGA